MRYLKGFLFFTLSGFFILGLTSCFKEKFVKVGLPQDVNPADTTDAPQKTNATRKVLLIGIDGCSGIALKNADAPNIHELLKNSVYSFEAVTQPPTWSGPGWSSILSGVWSDKHNVTDNSFQGNHLDKYPTVFRYLRTLKPSSELISISAWSPINEYLATDANIRIDLPDNDVAVKDSAIQRLKTADPDLMFLQFDAVDAAGHTYGFDTNVPEYMNAIHATDQLVGNVMDGLKSRKNFAEEDWLVVITTDHGGVGKSHGGSSDAEKNTFIIFWNENFDSKEVIPPLTTLRGVTLQGGGGQYAYLDDFYDLDDFPELTIQFQIKTSMLSSDVPLITNKNWSSGLLPGFVINVRGQSWKMNIGDGDRRVDINANGVPDLNDDKWHSITASLDRAGEAKIYQDGKECGSTIIAGLSTITSDALIKLIINQDITRNYDMTTFAIANIKIWSSKLTDDYIAKNVCDTVLKPGDEFADRLIAWWKGTDGSGTLFKDSGAMKYDLKLVGQPQWTVQSLDFCNNPIPPSVTTSVDIMPTVLTWLNFNVDFAGWNLDGRSWVKN